MEIVLKEFHRKDLEILVNWLKDESEKVFVQWGGLAVFKYPLDTTQLENHLKSSEGEKPIRKLYKAVNNETNVMVGYIELNNINRESRSAVVSRVLVGGASNRGNGIGYQMVKKVVEIGFNEFNVHRISLGVFDFNQGAVECYKKVGFIYEGVLRESLKVGDEFWSSIQMSILEHEWKGKQTTK